MSNTRSNDLFAWTGSAAGTTGFEVNGRNQIAKQDGVQFSHDAKGNLLSDGTRSYSYTAENRLASGASTHLYYDALGRLAHLTSGINFHYHGGEFIETQSASGATRRYVHGPGTDEPLVWYEGAGTNDRRYLHADERGSIVAVSDGSGNVLGINKYDEYGNPAATNIGRFGYTGQVWLPELGLWHYKARMYDPRLGRFLQPDPIGYEEGLNMYAYVGGDPVNFTDPNGLKAQAPPAAPEGICGKVTGSKITRCGEAYARALEDAGFEGEYEYTFEFSRAPGGGRQVTWYLSGLIAPNAPLLPAGYDTPSVAFASAEFPCLSPVDCARTLRDALVRLQTKPKPPLSDARMTAFAKAAGFPQGLKDSAAALRGPMNPFHSMQSLKNAGFNRQDVVGVETFYSITYERNHKNISAFYRTELLRGVLKVWK